MHVEHADFRPRTTFDMRVLTIGALIGGLAMIVAIASSGYLLFVVLPRVMLAAGILEPNDFGVEPEPIEEAEPEVIQAAFVQLGREFDPRELPDRQVSRSTLAQRRQDPNLVSQLTRAVTDGGVPPPNAHESLLSQLGNRAEFIERTSIAETEGVAEGMEEGRRSEGSFFAGQIQTLFRRGLVVPPSIPESEYGQLAARVTVVLREDLSFESIRIVSSSGNPDFDRAVQNRIDDILATGATGLTPPTPEEHDTFIGRPFGVRVTPPSAGRRRPSSPTQGAAPSGGGSALDRLGAGYNTGD